MVIPDCNDMIKRGIAISFFFLCAISVSAQRNRSEKTEPVIVIGKALNQRDSIRVKELFFDGLQEKLSMNYAQAASSFFQKFLIWILQMTQRCMSWRISVLQITNRRKLKD